MIIDCFTFFNELELLEVRLHTLAPHVDAFILCESNRTFQGAEKPYLFDEWFFRSGDDPARYCGSIKCYEDAFGTGKPLYIVRADLSYLDSYLLWTHAELSPWYREYAQRRKIMDALHVLSISDEDRIILSDVDEIPNIDRSILADIVESPYIIAWKQDLYYYWVNMRCWDWIGPVSCTAKTLRHQFNCDLQALRQYRNRADFVIVGGWHFSFLGGPSAIKKKIEAFSHTEFRHFADLDHIEQALTKDWKQNSDVFGRHYLGMKFEVMPDDYHLPVYLRENKDRFRNWWYEGE